MARSGMADIIAELRSMTDAGTSDYTIGTVAFWTDDLLQAALDMNRYDLTDHPLIANPKHEAGTLVYKEYLIGYRWLESGSAIFTVNDGDFEEVGTANYTADYARGIVTFSADQLGSSYYLTGRAYDLNGAASQIWARKASHYAAAINFSTDNHRVDRGMLIEHAMKMSSFYGQQSGGGMSAAAMYERGDTWG